MKKYVIRIAVLVVAAMTAVSCGEDPNIPGGGIEPPPGSGETDTEERVFIKSEAVYYGNDKDTGTGRYTLKLLTDNINGLGIPTGESAVLYLECFGDLTDSPLTTPFEGTYSASAQAQGAKHTFTAGNVTAAGAEGTYIVRYTAEEGGLVETKSAVVSGSFTSSAGVGSVVIEGELTDDNGDIFTVEYSGALIINDQSAEGYYRIDGAYCRYYGDKYSPGAGGYDLFLYKGNGFDYEKDFWGNGYVIYLESYSEIDLDPDNPTLPVGTYQVTDAYNMVPYTFCLGFYYNQILVSSSLRVYQNSVLTGEAPIQDGTFEVDRSGDTYTIAANLMTGYNEPVEVTFTGPIEFVNASGITSGGRVDLKTVAGASHNGDIYGTGAENFALELTTEDGDSGLVLEGYSTQATPFVLEEGTYSFSDDFSSCSLAEGSWDYMKFLHGTYAYERASNGLLESGIIMAGGSMTVERSDAGYTIYANFTGKDVISGSNKQYNAVYRGNIDFTDLSVREVFEGTFTSAQGYYYGGTGSGKGKYEIELYKGSKDSSGNLLKPYEVIVLDLYSAAADDPENARPKGGTYYPSYNFDQESFYPGIVLDDHLYHSFYGKSTTAGSIVVPITYGKAVVGISGDNYTITIDAAGRIHDGDTATVRYNYTGPINFEYTPEEGTESLYKSPVPALRMPEVTAPRLPGRTAETGREIYRKRSIWQTAPY